MHESKDTGGKGQLDLPNNAEVAANKLSVFLRISILSLSISSLGTPAGAVGEPLNERRAENSIS